MKNRLNMLVFARVDNLLKARERGHRDAGQSSGRSCFRPWHNVCAERRRGREGTSLPSKLCSGSSESSPDVKIMHI